jgi:tetratricopeptide (TPR) repeat protein
MNFKVVIVTSFVFLLLSCTETQDNFNAFGINSDNVEIEQLNTYLLELNPKDVPAFLIYLIGLKPDKNIALESWLLEQLSLGEIDLELFTQFQAKSLLEALYDTEMYDLATTWSYLILKNNRLKNVHEVKSAALVILASEYSFQKDQDSLQKYVELLHKVMQMDTTRFIQLSYYTNNASLAQLTGKFLEANISYYNALEFVKADDTDNYATIYQNIASMYLNMDNVEKAYLNLQKSLEYRAWQEMPLDHLNTIGIIMWKYGDFEEAELVFNKLIDESTKNNVMYLQAQTYSNYANLKTAQEKYDEGIHYLNQSDSIFRVIDLSVGSFFNTINRGSLYLQQNNYKQAANYYEKARLLNETYAIPNIELTILKGLYESYEGLDRKDLAFNYFKKYIEQREALVGDAPSTLIADWKLSKEESANKLKDNKLKSLQKKQEIQLTFFTIIAILSIIILIMAYAYFKKKRQVEQEKHQREQQNIAYILEKKSKELLMGSIKNVSVQYTKNHIHDELVEIIKDLPKSHNDKFKALIKILKSNSQDFLLEQFDNHFIEVYESFYQKIIQLAPDLTANELRVCAMMRINMSSKEIAMLTNRTLGTIENIRSDVRKKMNLSNDRNLQDFILKI